MEERMLSELTRAQIEYTTIHINNLINLCILGNEIRRTDMLAEEHALHRFVNTYKSKYNIDKNTNNILMRYMEQGASIIKLYTNNKNEGE